VAVGGAGEEGEGEKAYVTLIQPLIPRRLRPYEFSTPHFPALSLPVVAWPRGPFEGLRSSGFRKTRDDCSPRKFGYVRTFVYKRNGGTILYSELVTLK